MANKREGCNKDRKGPAWLFQVFFTSQTSILRIQEFYLHPAILSASTDLDTVLLLQLHPPRSIASHLTSPFPWPLSAEEPRRNSPCWNLVSIKMCVFHNFYCAGLPLPLCLRPWISFLKVTCVHGGGRKTMRPIKNWATQIHPLRNRMIVKGQRIRDEMEKKMESGENDTIWRVGD